MSVLNKSDYTDEQWNAILENDKNLRIIACAGSGKTRVLVGKIQYLLTSEKYNIKPENILAFTYTEKAANELKSRVIKKLDTTSGLADMFVGTIHGWCLNKLQYHNTKYQKYSVLDEIKLKLFVDKYYDNIGMKKVFKISIKQPMRRFIDTGIFINIMNNLREFYFEKDEVQSNLKEALSDYEQQLKHKNYFDFTMILTETLKTLNNPDSSLTQYIKTNLKYLFVDEYQDINPIQEQLIEKIREISSCKIFVVGDDDQNIYQWRGSNNKYIIDFHKKFDESTFKNFTLDINFRSSKGIVSLGETLIKNNKNRISSKKMGSANRQDYNKRKDIIYYDNYNTVMDETYSIANYIKNILGVPFSDEDAKNRGLDYSDICILIRKWDKAYSITQVFDELEIPYITGGVNQLFEQSEVRAALGLFQYLNGDISLEELISLWKYIYEENQLLSLFNEDKIRYAISGNDKRALNNKFPELDEKNWAYNLQDIYWNFLDLAEIDEKSFGNSNKAEIIFFNLGKFSQVINDFEEINFNSSVPSFHLFSFLSFVKYVAVDYYPEGWMNHTYKTPKAVQIMTVHQAKGLEFPVVIIPGMSQNYFPAKKKGGLSEKHFINDTLYKKFQEYQKDTETEDERRLLYVAITRSQKYLLITRSNDDSNRLYKKPSIFLYELPSSNSIIENFPDRLFDDIDKGTPTSKDKLQDIQIDFSKLKDYFECPYRFKLVSLYGFCFPLNQRMGVGKSFHNCLMDFHKRIKEGEKIDNIRTLVKLVQEQESYPYMSKSSRLKKGLHRQVRNGVVKYCIANLDEGLNIEFIEQDIQYKIDENIIIVGRIDLVKKRKEDDSFETTIIEFKSKDNSASSRLTEHQLKMYALGHKELTGEIANYIETYIIGEDVKKYPKPISEQDLIDITEEIKEATSAIKNDNFKHIKEDQKADCKDCFQNRLCEKRREYQIESKL